tara:strand:+ start:7561 stop:7812 length:252 start_codon:yes stop_codon:yes gene_type:complete
MTSLAKALKNQWQLFYYPEEPIRVPAGSWLLVTGSFDNSAANPANPDYAKRVFFGQQSWDEMFIGFSKPPTIRKSLLWHFLGS